MTTKSKPSKLNAADPAIETTVTSAPANGVTGKKYFGQLAADLQKAAEMKGYASHEWATLKKWNSIGETVTKGEKGWLLLRTPKNQVEGGEDKELPTRFFLFNRSQLESYRQS